MTSNFKKLMHRNNIALLLTIAATQALAEQPYNPPVADLSVENLVQQTSDGNELKAFVLNKDSPQGTSNKDAHSVLNTLPQKRVSTESTVLSRLRKENRQLKKNSDQLGEQLEMLRTQLATATKLKPDVESQIGALETSLEVKESQLAENKQEITSLQNALTDSRTALSTATEKLNAAQRDVAQLKHVSELIPALTASRDQAKSAQKLTETDLAELKKQASEERSVNKQMEETLKTLRGQLVQANERASKAVKQSKPSVNTGSEKQAYVVGQVIASNLREKLAGYTQMGIPLNLSLVTAGISDGLSSKAALKNKEMDDIYTHFATQLQSSVSNKLVESQALLAKKVAGRTPTKAQDGLSWFVVKKGKAITDPEAAVTIAMSESIADGRTISRIPTLTVGQDDDIPEIIHEALPLLGEGSEVVAYALAKSVYQDRPMPKGVMPFTVLEYHLSGLKQQ